MVNHDPPAARPTTKEIGDGMKQHRVKVLYHPRQNVMGLWRDRGFPYHIFANGSVLKGWNVWVKLKYARQRGWVVICDLEPPQPSEAEKLGEE